MKTDKTERSTNIVIEGDVVVSNLRRIDFEAEIKVNQEIKVKDMATEISILLLLFTINL